MVKIGIIGGTGLENPDFLKDFQEKDVETPFGKPSSKLICGKISDVDIAIISRHGKTHTIMPTNVNNRANVWALKQEGCTHILAATACGSLRDNIKPGDLVFIDQFIDRTSKRHMSFYGDDAYMPNAVCHIPMAEPFCHNLKNILIYEAEKLGLGFHAKGTIVTIEGPRFSTKAESHMFRQWGADVINMSTVPEVVLAREAGLCYASVAMSTDYDCWKEMEESVDINMILQTMKTNAENVTKLFLSVIPKIKHTHCECNEHIKTAVMGEVSEVEKNDIVERKDNNLTAFHENEKKDNIQIKSKIRTIPNWPKQGIMFRDITTLLKDPIGLQLVIDDLVKRYRGKPINKIVGIESRGFVIGGALSYALGIGCVLARKPGKLPAATESQEYLLEYGKDKIEIHKDAISSGDNVLIIDDLLATGGTAMAAIKLVEKLGGKVQEAAFIVDLPEVGGRKKLQDAGYNVYWLTEFEGE